MVDEHDWILDMDTGYWILDTMMVLVVVMMITVMTIMMINDDDSHDSLIRVLILMVTDG